MCKCGGHGEAEGIMFGIDRLKKKTIPVKHYGPLELLQQLKAEHNEHYVYRGEPQQYPPPMWPSKYRRSYVSENYVRLNKELTLRRCGAQFFFRLDFVRDPSHGKDPVMYERLMKSQHLLQMCMAHLRNALGYALAEAMYQQAGWSSEGIDVSYNPMVAMTFALSKWQDGQAHLWNRPEPAVVYRFKIEKVQWSLDDLRKYNYYSCPSLIPTRELCRLFPTGSHEDFRTSLHKYQQAIAWNSMDFDLGALQGKRPFEILHLPRSWATQSRVERQHAALLLPDSVHPGRLREIALQGDLGMMGADCIGSDGHRLSVGDCLGHGNFVEDVRTRPGVETFVIDASSSDKIKEIAPHLDMNIFPPYDMTFDLLANWIKPFYRPLTAYGTLPIDFSFTDINPNILWEALGQFEPERQFCK